MRAAVVQTTNTRAFLDAVERVEERGAREACLIVVDGEPGLGKTTVINRWCVQTGSVYARAQEGWTGNWAISQLLTECAIHPPTALKERFDRLVAELVTRAAAAQAAGRSFGVVIDEADLISSKRGVMETIRGISDAVLCPTILVGMGRLREHLRRFPQIESRAPHKVAFGRATPEDVAALFEGLCEVPVAPDLVALVHRLSGGLNREIMEAIAHVERFGRRVRPGPEGVSVRAMEGEPIMSDRRTGQPIAVPRVP
jgi:DNA transposition AAA+ family ATPase